MNARHVRSIITGIGVALLGAGLAACSAGPSASSSAPTAQTAARQAAPTVQAIATQAAPTLQALSTSGAVAATQGVPTVQALATQAAPTAQALATQAAPTAQAAATQVAPVAATASASAPVHILGVQATQTDATVTLQNTSTGAVDLSGWILQVGTGTVQLPSGVDVLPGQSVTLHTASGTSTASDVFLGTQANTIVQQLKPGAQVVLQNPSGAPTTAFTVPSA